LDLLASQNNELFLRCFKEHLKALVRDQIYLFESEKTEELPRDFLVNHVSAAFVEAVRFWIDNGMKETPETLTEYFMRSVG
jgi:hypothetical protein